MFTLRTEKERVSYFNVRENTYKFAKGFSWDGSKYILDNDTAITFFDISDSSNIISLNNAHYTCWNTTGECTTLSYIYYLAIYGTNHSYDYINLTDGKSIEDAKNEMLYNNDTNTNDSTIKKTAEAWYRHYMLNYDDYIEDTIFCNDRSQTNADTNGWNPNGGDITTFLYFKGYTATTDLSCVNTTDKFSVSNPNATLTYKVGLLSSPEAILLNRNNIRDTDKCYWIGSPSDINDFNHARGRLIYIDGSIQGNYSISTSWGLRPVISLIPGIEYTSGDGSMANPYIVSTG